jgi:hypothetical protein
MKKMGTKTGVLLLIGCCAFNGLLRADTAAEIPAERAERLATKQVAEAARALLQYEVEHDGKSPVSLVELTGELPNGFPTQMLSYIQRVRHDGPVKADALSTTPLLVDQHSLHGAVVVAYRDGHVEIMRTETFQEIVMANHLVCEPSLRQIALELRVLQINEQFAQEIASTIQLSKAEPNASAGHVAAGPANNEAVRRLLDAEPTLSTDRPLQDIEKLDDLQAGFLKKEAMQRIDSRQLTAPKAVVLDGELATIEVKTAIAYTDTDGLIKEFTKGVRIAVRPTLEDDGTSIRLRGTFRMVDVTGWEVRYAGDQEFSIPLVEIYEFEFHHLIPDRATALLGSVLSTAKTDADAVTVQRLFLLVTPTVIKEMPFEETLAPQLSQTRNEVYDVSDLVSPTDDPNPVNPSLDTLMQEIKAVVPSSWRENGGIGRIDTFGNSKLLIWQTPQEHQTIKTFFKQKREAL